MQRSAYDHPCVLNVHDHPLLDVAAFTSTFAAPLETLPTPQSIAMWLDPAAKAPFATSDDIKKAVRDLLRQGGYRPTGRGKPASEFLLGASAEGPLNSINLAVDACNGVSLHSGLPISVVDLDRAREPLSIQVAGAEARYVFNASGQTIDLEGLLCLFDADDPCANAVKDAQRTKTHGGTRRTLSIVWGTKALPGRTVSVARWYRALLEEAGIATSDLA
jgi:DNA/RNA-binding domain of Phe-tRNA-synthetase-like protein